MSFRYQLHPNTNLFSIELWRFYIYLIFISFIYSLYYWFINIDVMHLCLISLSIKLPQQYRFKIFAFFFIENKHRTKLRLSSLNNSIELKSDISCGTNGTLLFVQHKVKKKREKERICWIESIKHINNNTVWNKFHAGLFWFLFIYPLGSTYILFEFLFVWVFIGSKRIIIICTRIYNTTLALLWEKKERIYNWKIHFVSQWKKIK